MLIDQLYFFKSVGNKRAKMGRGGNIIYSQPSSRVLTAEEQYSAKYSASEGIPCGIPVSSIPLEI